MTRLWRDQAGHTLMETLVVVHLVGLMAGLAVYGGVGAARSAQLGLQASAAVGHIRLAQQDAIGRHHVRRVRFDPSSMVGSGYTRYYVEWFKYPPGDVPNLECVADEAMNAAYDSYYQEETQVTLPDGQTIEVAGATDLNDGRGPMLYFDCTGKPANLPAGSDNVTITFRTRSTTDRTVTVWRHSGRVEGD